MRDLRRPSGLEQIAAIDGWWRVAELLVRGAVGVEVRDRLEGTAVPTEGTRAKSRSEVSEHALTAAMARRNVRLVHDPQRIAIVGGDGLALRYETTHLLVGLPGLEPGTFGPPDRRANQAAPQPVDVTIHVGGADANRQALTKP